MLTIFYGVFSTFQNARRASRITHRASCTLDDASLALQHDAELRRLALVGTLQQRQGALAGMRVDLRERFYAAEGYMGYFPVGAFFYYYYWGYYWGFCVNY